MARFSTRPEIDPPVSRSTYRNEAARGGGASIRPTLSTSWLSRSLASEARHLDAHIHGKLGNTLSPLTKKHIPRRPCCSLNYRSGAAVQSRESQLVRSSPFNRKNSEEVSDRNHASKHWLFATFVRLFSSPRASSRCLPSFASRRRLLGLRWQSLRTPECWSGADLDDLGAKIEKDYEDILAKNWRLGTDENAFFLRLNVRANIPEQRRVQAGPLTGYIAMCSLPDWSIFMSFAKACHGKSLNSGFLLFLERQGEHEYYNLTKKSGAYHTSLNHQRSTKSSSQTQKCL